MSSVLKLSQLATISAGQGAPQGADKYSNSGTPFIKAGDLLSLINGQGEESVQKVSEKVAESHRLKLFPSGTVLFAKSGMSCMKGYVYVLKKDCYVVSHLACITPQSIEPEYLRYYFEYHKPNFLVKDAAYPSISLTDIGAIDIVVPESTLRSRIINILSSIDRAISYRQKELLDLEQLVKSRFIELFGDVISNSKNWPIHMLAEIAASRLGKMLDAKQQTGENNYPYLANFNVQWFRFELDSLNQMDFNEDDRTEFELRDGDLLICEGGEIGRCAVWHDELQPCYFQKALHRVRCDRQFVHPDYLAWWFKYNCDHNGFAAIAGAKATIAHLTGVKLKQLQVALPPIELQEQFAGFVEQTDKSKYYSSLSYIYCQLTANYFRQEWTT